ncbi:MAG: hypothetical protein CL670_00655 [Balneola sp.]|nr:hypothetical protein [Balneola sp.]MBE77643.1 hypothetical protein [Balneola sp.]
MDKSIKKITYKSQTKVFTHHKDPEIADQHLATITVTHGKDNPEYHYDIIEMLHNDLKEKYPDQVQSIDLESHNEEELYFKSEHIMVVERDEKVEHIYLDGRYTGNEQELENKRFTAALEEYCCSEDKMA